MEIILREDIPKLGNKGDIVMVKDGYARNYLLPRRLAILATTGTRKQVDQMRASAERKADREKGAAEALAAQLSALDLSFTKRAGDQGQLFGSVTASDLAEAIAGKGFEIDRRRLELNEPLKRLGEFAVPIRLHRDVTAELTVKVLSETGEEAPPPPEVAAPAEEVEAALEAVGESSGQPGDETAKAEETAAPGGEETPDSGGEETPDSGGETKD